MSQKKTLFDEDSDGEEETLQINKAYATKYEEFRRGEELEKLKNLYGEDGVLTSDSESSSDGDYVEPDNPEFDRDFFLSLGALHKKNEVNLEEHKFFAGDYRIKKKDKEEKPMTIRDYEHHINVNLCGEGDEENNSMKVKDPGDSPFHGKKISGFHDKDDSSDDDGDGLLTSGLFTVKDSTKKEKKEESSKKADDVVAFVKGESSTVNNTKDEVLLEGLRNAWKDPNLSKDDVWLADYFLNKRYLEDEDETIERAYNEVVIDEETLSEDEKTLEKMETFEAKYRFRYEEPDEEFIKRYPRCIPDSVRPKDDRRKVKRETLKERKKKEKELKRMEIQRLKALKYKEIEAKIAKIKEVSGNNDIDLGEKELDGDFDPAAHDNAMSHVFGEDYYKTDDGSTEKPVFSDDEDIIKDYDDWLEKQGPGTAGNAGEWEEDEAEYADWDGEDFNMDADYDPTEAKRELQKEMIEASGKRKRKRRTKFAKALSKKKPVFDPKEKNFDSYFDEYYQLDFEDIIGDTPCRFKYRKVESNDFGLSTEEILTARDKELNRWFSLKKILQHNRTKQLEQQEQIRYRNRAKLLHVKQKILPSLFVENPEELQVTEEEKKRQKNLKKKLRKQQRLQDNIEKTILVSEETDVLPSEGKDTSVKRQLEDANGLSPKKCKRPKTEQKNEEEKVADQSNYSSVNESEFPNSRNALDASEPDDGKSIKKKKIHKVTESSNTDVKEPDSIVVSPKNRKKKKKNKSNSGQGQVISFPQKLKTSKKERAMNKNNHFLQGICDARLLAYGQNPKKLKNAVKYGKQSC